MQVYEEKPFLVGVSLLLFTIGCVVYSHMAETRIVHTHFGGKHGCKILSREFVDGNRILQWNAKK
jgi:hypothetical protein